MEQNRIRELVNSLGLRPHEFARSIGITNQCLNGWMSRPITKGKAFAINRYYPNVSVSWLLTGEGKMLNSPSHLTQSPPNCGDLDALSRRILYLERENERLLGIIERFLAKR